MLKIKEYDICTINFIKLLLLLMTNLAAYNLHGAFPYVVRVLMISYIESNRSVYLDTQIEIQAYFHWKIFKCLIHPDSTDAFCAYNESQLSVEKTCLGGRKLNWFLKTSLNSSSWGKVQ